MSTDSLNCRYKAFFPNTSIGINFTGESVSIALDSPRYEDRNRRETTNFYHALKSHKKIRIGYKVKKFSQSLLLIESFLIKMGKTRYSRKTTGLK